jgi:hypothetical protein
MTASQEITNTFNHSINLSEELIFENKQLTIKKRETTNMKEGDIYYSVLNFDCSTYVNFYIIKKVWNKFVTLKQVGKKENAKFQYCYDGCRYTVEPDVNITPEPSGIFRKNPDKKFKIYSDEDGYSLKTNSWNGIKEYKGVPIDCYEEQHRNNDPLIIDTPELSHRLKNIPTETPIKRRFQEELTLKLPATVESLTDMVKEGKITPEQYSLMDDSILHMPTTPVEFFC